MQAAGAFGSEYTLLNELQADCLAGVYLGSIPNVTFDENDLVEMLTFSAALGDYEIGSDWHGTPEMRMEALAIGLLSLNPGDCSVV